VGLYSRARGILLVFFRAKRYPEPYHRVVDRDSGWNWASDLRVTNGAIITRQSSHTWNWGGPGGSMEETKSIKRPDAGQS
jgi:hypothetical protein